MRLLHSVRSPGSVPVEARARTISVITWLQSPTMGTSGWRILPSSAGSMSTWITLACGAKESTRPVTRSSKRAPRAMSRSDSCMAVMAV